MSSPSPWSAVYASIIAIVGSLRIRRGRHRRKYSYLFSAVKTYIISPSSAVFLFVTIAVKVDNVGSIKRPLLSPLLALKTPVIVAFNNAIVGNIHVRPYRRRSRCIFQSGSKEAKCLTLPLVAPSDNRSMRCFEHINLLLYKVTM